MAASMRRAGLISHDVKSGDNKSLVQYELDADGEASTQRTSVAADQQVSKSQLEEADLESEEV